MENFGDCHLDRVAERESSSFVSTDPFLDEALFFARNGFPVFPCRGKVPGIEKGNGLHDASADPDTVRRLWDRCKGGNIGLRTGEEARFWVLDIDGQEGEASIASLESQHGPLPETITATSGSGGRHLYFRHPGRKVYNRQSDIGDHLDTRGDGGYIIAPPSIHPDTHRRYQWADGVVLDLDSVAKAPGWLIDLACSPENAAQRQRAKEAKERPATPAASTKTASSGSGSDGYYQAALEKECRTVAQAQVGQRNGTLNNAAFKLGSLIAGKNLEQGVVESRLLLAAEACGLVKEDGKPACLATIRSGMTAGIAGGPRYAPEREMPISGAIGTKGSTDQKAEPEPAFDTKEEKKDLFPLLSLPEMFRLPKPKWRMKGVLPETGIAIIFGASGAKKSFAAVDWSCHIAHGMNWQGNRVNQTGVVYVASEDSNGIAAQRVPGWHLWHGLMDTNPPLRVVPCAVDLTDALQVEKMVVTIREEVAKSNFEIRMVVIDTLARSMSGDENSGEVMGKFITACTTIQKEINGLVLIVHHSGWGDSSRTRGHSSLWAATDARFMVESQKGSRDVNLSILHLKNGKSGQDYHLHASTVELGHDEDGDMVTTLVLTASEEDKPQIGVPNLTKKEKIVLDVLTQSGCTGLSYNEWWEKCQRMDVGSKTTFSNAVNMLKRDGFFTKNGSNRYILKTTPD